MEEKKNSGRLFKLLAILLAIIVVILFSIANNDNVKVSLVFTETQVPLIALLIGNLLIGFFVGATFWTLSSIRSRKTIKAKEKEISSLEERLRNLHEKIEDLRSSHQD